MLKRQIPISRLKGFLSGSGLILLLLASGCSVTLFSGLKPRSVGPEQPVSWFASDTGHFLFNTRIGLMKNHYSGLTIIKPDSTGSYRMAMITEVGLKLIDMELVPGNNKPHVYYVMDALNRKMLIRTLSSDLNLMLINHGAEVRSTMKTDRKKDTRVVRFNGACRKYDYYLYPELVKPQTAYSISGIRRKVKVDFYSHNGSEIDSVKMAHSGLKLTIDLYRIP
jgi:hypothetical protein